MQQESPYSVDFLSYHSPSFCICSALQTILPSVSTTLPLKTHYLSRYVSPHSLMQPLLFLLGHFIILLLNILQPIVPKELVCDNMKIWPHLAEVVGNKHLTRGWADGASNSNLLWAPCWFGVLPGSARFPLPVVSTSQKISFFLFLCLPPLSSIGFIDIDLFLKLNV